MENPGLEQEAVKFGFYAVMLIENGPDGCGCCGCRYDDYAYASMVFITPGEDCTPAAVAMRLGFASFRSFSLLFRKLTGVAPGEYRQSQN